MKKVSIGFFVLIIALVIAGCATTPKEPVELPNIDGTFKDSWNMPNSSGTFVFTNSHYSYQRIDDGTILERYSSEGTFTLTEKQISFIASNGKKWKQGYKFAEGRLILSQTSGHDYGTFVKQ
jgi:hypothetical protein